MCEAMKWNHLPVAGGIYDQRPELLAQWGVIWEERVNYEKEKERKERNSPKGKKAK